MFAANANASEEVPLFAFVDDGGQTLQTTGTREATFPLSPARPGGYVLADPGGALFFLGGGQPGVDVLVLE